MLRSLSSALTKKHNGTSTQLQLLRPLTNDSNNTPDHHRSRRLLCEPCDADADAADAADADAAVCASCNHPGHSARACPQPMPCSSCGDHHPFGVCAH